MHVNVGAQIEKEVQLCGGYLLLLLLSLQPIFLNFLWHHHESGSNMDVLKVVLCPPGFFHTSGHFFVSFDLSRCADLK